MEAPSDDFPLSARLPVEDERGIIDAAVRYAAAIDRRAWDELDQVFTPDCYVDYGFVPSLTGPDAVKKFVSDTISHLDSTQHMVSNHQVCADGEGAKARCYLHAQHTKRGVEGGANFVVGGIYRDRLVKIDGVWRIAERYLERLWGEGNTKVLTPGA